MRKNNWKAGAGDTARSLFPVGTRIEQMTLQDGVDIRRGKVESIEPTGELNVLWDDKTNSKIILGLDSIRKLRPDEIEEEKRMEAPQWYEIEIYAYRLYEALLDYCKKVHLQYEAYNEDKDVYIVKIRCTNARFEKVRKWIEKRCENEGKFADLEFSM